VREETTTTTKKINNFKIFTKSKIINSKKKNFKKSEQKMQEVNIYLKLKHTQFKKLDMCFSN
jgi:hypothetical protein